MSDRRIVNSILLFERKHEKIAGSREAVRYNGELHPELKKQLESIISQAKRL